MIGERAPTRPRPYGARGNAVVRYFGETYDNIVLVGGFSKAYSSLLAFLAVPTWLKEHLKVAAPPYLYSGPSPTASLATVLAGLRRQRRRGDAIRADLYRKTERVLDHVARARRGHAERQRHPDHRAAAGRRRRPRGRRPAALGRGIYVTLAAYPLVPRAEVGFRVQLTAANTDEEVDELLAAITALAERSLLR